MSKVITFLDKSDSVDSDTEYESCKDVIPLGLGCDDTLFVSIKDADEIVIPDKKIKVAFDYPLKDIFVFELDCEDGYEEAEGKCGFTRKCLASVIIRKYNEIYEDEKRTFTEKLLENWGESHPSYLLMNKMKTTGTYGMFGHDFRDLMLHSVRYNDEKEYWELEIDNRI